MIKNKEKSRNSISVVSVLLKIALYVAMVFSVWFNLQRFLDSTPYLALFSNYNIANIETYTTLKYLMPFVSGLFVYFLYYFYSKYVFKMVNGSLFIIDLAISFDSFRKRLDPCFILLCILLGFISMISSYYPLFINIGEGMCRTIAAAITIVGMCLSLSKGLEKKNFVILYIGLMMPFIILIVMV